MSFRDLLGKEFLQYCDDNKLEKVKACLTLEVDVNTVSEEGERSGLTIAAEKNNIELLNILLSHPGIEINKTVTLKSDEDGGKSVWSVSVSALALMFAAWYGNSAVVARLVQEEQINIKTRKEEVATKLEELLVFEQTCVMVSSAKREKLSFN